jgi:hypothetical protein
MGFNASARRVPTARIGQFGEALVRCELSHVGRIKGYGHRLSCWSDARNDLRFATGGLPGVMITTGAAPVRVNWYIQK